MKKIVTLLFVAVAMSIVACGPSAAEKAKMEAQAKAKMDSLFNAASQSMTAAKDSVAPATPAAPATEVKK
jgi:hypothetical protein